MLEELKEANEYIYNHLNKIEKDDYLKKIEEYAKENNVPIITKEVAEFLKFLIKNNKTKNILEIGTAIAYSGIVMLNSFQESKLTTIEIDEERFKEAKKNFEIAKLEARVKLILSDANEELDKINDNFDFIFIDASKGQYKNFFDKSFEKLNSNGLIFIDNIMFRGYLYKEYPKKYKTIVRKLNEFIAYLYENYDFTLLPFGDGIGIVRKK